MYIYIYMYVCIYIYIYTYIYIYIYIYLYKLLTFTLHPFLVRLLELPVLAMLIRFPFLSSLCAICARWTIFSRTEVVLEL